MDAAPFQSGARMLAAKFPLIVHSFVLLSLIALLFGVSIGFAFLLISLAKNRPEDETKMDESEPSIKTA